MDSTKLKTRVTENENSGKYYYFSSTSSIANWIFEKTRTFAGKISMNQKSFDDFEQELNSLVISSKDKNRSLSIKKSKFLSEPDGSIDIKLITKNPDWDAYCYLTYIVSEEHGMGLSITKPISIETEEKEIYNHDILWNKDWKKVIDKEII